MANSQRRILDRNGNQFIPMNVEGQSYSDSFWQTYKVVTLVCILLAWFSLIAFLSSNPLKPLGYVVMIGGLIFVTVELVRYVIFEEKFYYRMYKELQGNEITTPAIFWNIASIKNTEDGAILTYADARVGVMVKIDRDTITGKPVDFEELHYDAISDFYRELTRYGYSFVQLNIMELAGKDPRLAEIDKIPNKCDNANIRKLVELQIGHIKNIAQNSLYESDYMLIYTSDITKIDNIISDVIEIMFTLLNGAYIGFRIMNQQDLIELEKESFGIKYFNSTDASLNIYKNDVNSRTKPFTVSGIVWDDGEEQELDTQRQTMLRNITLGIIREQLTLEKANIKEKIYKKKEDSEYGIDFDKLSKVPYDSKSKQGKIKPNMKKPNINIMKPNMVRPNQVNQQQQMMNQQTQQQNNTARNNQMQSQQYNQQNINLSKQDNQYNNQNYFDTDFTFDDDDVVDI